MKLDRRRSASPRGALKTQDEKTLRDTFELDRVAWNLPRPLERPQTQPSVRPASEGTRESGPEAA